MLSLTRLAARSLFFVTVTAATTHAQITPGNLTILRVGTGSAALTNAATAVFLDEYTPAGTLVQSIPLPTTASGANRAFANSGTATSEGILTQSVDGRFLIAAGYDAAPGLAAIASTTSAAVPRVVACVDLDGTIDTSTGIDNAFSGNNIRSAASYDGSWFWSVGANSGVVYSDLGTASGTSLNTAAPINLRVVDVFDGQLYVSSGSGSFRGVLAFGSGMPTTSGQTPMLLPGFPTANSSPFDFFFADADTVYVADDRTNGQGGIEKWTQNAGTWTLQYTLSPNLTTGARGLTGIVDGGIATLFATTTGNQLIRIVDTGPGSSITVLTSAWANTAFRGLRLVRQPYAVTTTGVASPTTVGDPTLGVGGGLPVVGNTSFHFVIGNLLPFGFGCLVLGLGDFMAPIGIPGAPATAQLYVLPLVSDIVVGDGVGAVIHALPIPSANVLAGTSVTAQLAALDPALVAALPIGTSIGLRVTIGQ